MVIAIHFPKNRFIFHKPKYLVRKIFIVNWLTFRLSQKTENHYICKKLYFQKDSPESIYWPNGDGEAHRTFPSVSSCDINSTWFQIKAEFSKLEYSKHDGHLLCCCIVYWWLKSFNLVFILVNLSQYHNLVLTLVTPSQDYDSYGNCTKLKIWIGLREKSLHCKYVNKSLPSQWYENINKVINKRDFFSAQTCIKTFCVLVFRDAKQPEMFSIIVSAETGQGACFVCSRIWIDSQHHMLHPPHFWK